MILMIDNYDSFTYNLVQYLGELGEELEVRRNDEITLSAIRRLRPKKIVISPGPGSPKNAGISKSVVRQLGPKIPILGVCLGHQCIGEVFGSTICLADRIMHGKTSEIYHDGAALFSQIASPFTATRYHSLIVPRKLPKALKLIAWTDQGEVMGVAHRDYPVWGVQFHPESILTIEGKQVMRNFVEL